MRLTIQSFLGAIALLMLASAPLGAVDLRQEVHFDIPAQKLDAALVEFSKQARLQVVTAGQDVQDLRTEGATGTLSISVALSQLLRSSGLSFRPIGANAISIGRFEAGADTSQSENDSGAGNGAERNLRLVQVGSTAAAQDSTAGAGKDQGSAGFEEIVVTAQKRAERLQEVPVPVTVVEADRLIYRNQLRLQDYYTEIPGLSVTPSFTGAPQVTIRGITTGPGNPTVGTVIDDVPFGSATGVGGGFNASDIDPSELSRIEVLRGPQGTLYGANSIGGLIKYVTVDPSTDRLGGRVQLGTSSVQDGSDLGYTVRGSVNLPLGQTWAMRASAFTRHDPGYVDNVQTGEKDVNSASASGGRLSVLWRPSDALSLKLSAMLQKSERDGSNEVTRQPGLGDLEQSALINTGLYGEDRQAYSALLNATVGRMTLTCVTGYNINTVDMTVDLTPAFGGLTPFFGAPAGVGVYDPQHYRSRKFSQEVRLAIPLGEKMEWLLGAFYVDENTPVRTAVWTSNPTTGVLLDSWFFFTNANTLEEYAAFTNLTVQVSERFDVQLGARQSYNRQTFSSSTAGPWGPVLLGTPSPIVVPEVVSKNDSFTYLVTPRLKLSEGADHFTMAYARLASGFRAGGPNQNNVIFGLPLTYKPDSTDNYEVGLKGDLFARALSFDASLYYIDWKDIQLALAQQGLPYYANVSRARSRGVELSLELRPLRGLTIGAWAARNDSVLMESFPANSTVPGAAGDRLPYSARVSGNVSIDQEFPLTDKVLGSLGASLAYVGDRIGTFSATRQVFPSYTQVNFTAGAKYDAWAVNLFLTNLTDERGMLTGGFDALNPLSFNFIQPRTFGLSVSRSW